jgi:type I restriction-modification system DNA methylase subunit
MSEELEQKGLLDQGLVIGNYEYYNIGSTTLAQLVKAKIIPDREYGEYSSRKPDALLVDRRSKENIKVVCIIEHKEKGKFKSKKDRKGTAQQCNDLCQVLDADIGIATDGHSFIWFNPKQSDPSNSYLDKTTSASRSYSIVKDEIGNDFVKDFSIDQKVDETDITQLSVRTRKTLQNLELVIRSVSSTNSQLTRELTIDPSNLAKQIWQDVWSVTGATPEKCLYTFVELFIFKYLSDLNVLTEDEDGNKIDFKNIIALGPTKAFKNYTKNVRPFLRAMFPPSPEDGTTIINGTVLNPKVVEHGRVFHKIMKRFAEFGELKNIDPSFKSKVFAEFMKETISQKNWGQFFTPRNIIDAMIEISDIDKLETGSEICDPACGVGGFILEPLKVKENGLSFYFEVEGKEIKSRYKFHGFDKGFEKEEQLVIILAKANMLIFLSELIKKNRALSVEFSKLFNSTFRLLSNTILGTLWNTETDRYDLILTNPPYVTSGSSNYKEAIRKNARLADFYRINAMGVEGLFLEWIVRSLKPAKKAFVIIPDGILNRLNDNKLRKFIKDECIVDGIISLPIDAFYRNSKKTYILAITKKPERTSDEREAHKQTEPVFTYLVSDIGETLDVRRFTIEENDLKDEMVPLFNQFKGAKTAFGTTSKRCKIQSIDKFNPDQHWSVDRWWTKDEKVELGIEEVEHVVTGDEFLELLKTESTEFARLVHQAEMIIKNGS